MNDAVNSFLKEKAPVHIPVVVEEKEKQPEKVQVVTENQLPPFPANATPLDGSWQKVNGTT